MDVRRAFVFFREDGGWPGKALVGMLLYGIPAAIWSRFGFEGSGSDPASSVDALDLLWSGVPTVLALLATGGYQMRVTRRVAERRDVPLPAWDVVGDLVIDGLRLIGVTAGWLVAVGVVVGCPALAVVVATAAASEGHAPDRPDLGGGGWLVPPLLNALGSTAFGIILAAAVGRAAIARSVRAGLDVAGTLRTVRDRFGAHLAASAIVAGFGFATSVVSAFPPVSLFADGWGWVPLTGASAAASLYACVVTGHLYGQLYVLSHGEAVVARLGARPLWMGGSTA